MISEKQEVKNEKQKNILVVGNAWDQFGEGFPEDTENWHCELCPDINVSLAKTLKGEYDALLVGKDFFPSLHDRTDRSNERNVLENLPVGLALIDEDHKIVWFNRQFAVWCHDDREKLIGINFYDLLGRPELRGPDFCPFRTVRMTKKPTFTALYQNREQSREQNRPGRFLNMSVAPVIDGSNEISTYLVELHDVTDQNKEEVINLRLREAGRELADISKEDVLKLRPEERIAILRAKIAKYAKEILQFDTIEIRLLSHRIPLLLEPLLAIGMTDEAKQRVLYAKQEGNGITGRVAYHGTSYRMEDRAEDAFYLEGIPGARSSITVPLKRHGKVIGTFNVESQHPNAFSENDLHLLESYAQDVAIAIHTLDLLNFEQKDSAFKSLKTVYSDAVDSLNHILNECARLLQSDLSVAGNVRKGLHEIQGDVRTIQAIFQTHVTEVQPDLTTTVASDIDCRNFEILRGKRILLIDGDRSTGKYLSKILFFYGCTIETALKGEDALKMVETTRYDAFVSDVKLEDMSAYTLFERIGELIKVPFPPYIFMTGYGHDGGHVMTRAKLAGVLGYIFKPFKRAQLLKNLKLVISEAEKQNNGHPPAASSAS